MTWLLVLLHCLAPGAAESQADAAHDWSGDRGIYLSDDAVEVPDGISFDTQDT